MSMAVINSVFIKQTKDTIKNFQILIMFFVFPIVGAIMAFSLGEETKPFFVSTFATMQCAFAPVLVTVAIIAEEREKNTLRALIMSNVSALEYLISIGFFVLAATMITGASFILIGGFAGERLLSFLLSMVVGSVTSILLGMCIGAYAKNTAAANGIAMPVGMIFAFIPMVAGFNDTIKSFSWVLYSQQLSNLIYGEPLTLQSGLVIGGNLLVFIVLFIVLFNRNKLDK